MSGYEFPLGNNPNIGFLASLLRATSPRKLQRQASIFQRAHITKQLNVCGTPPDESLLSESFSQIGPTASLSLEDEGRWRYWWVLNSAGYQKVGCAHDHKLEGLCTTFEDTVQKKIALAV